MQILFFCIIFVENNTNPLPFVFYAAILNKHVMKIDFINIKDQMPEKGKRLLLNCVYCNVIHHILEGRLQDTELYGTAFVNFESNPIDIMGQNTKNKVKGWVYI